ncbi:hypothetical protein P168DRAFT_279530 [Aspergillus campestris IBT 28561]|uniref:Uncharacterized protein n=1 Tax=Aspergillus campestris (strain IBT 28561) TaxID=1392248 RepID=A0A2I1DCI3_ASPC2|nr:uncharacterized protein P168DRAFT_279530 [Aspergillus campestris IBT 28561]PKY07571.1 hypothetical protein P168DRAFT_279530 [Aspergillus campestris IBT 28561]
MRFWRGWPLWQKLSFSDVPSSMPTSNNPSMALLIGIDMDKLLVVAYGVCVLLYNRRAIRRLTAAKRRSATTQDAESYPMLDEIDEIPFGARALERGVKVEGIWTPSQSSLRRPVMREDKDSVDPAPRRILVNQPGEVQRSFQTFVPAPILQMPDSRHLETQRVNFDVSERAGYAHPGLSPPTWLHPPDINEPSKHQTLSERAKGHRSRWWYIRSSWLNESSDGGEQKLTDDEQNRASAEARRRRLSKFIDDKFRATPTEMFQLKKMPAAKI